MCYNSEVPRQVDHAERRRHVVEALWQVLRREGVHVVSVRSVAAEAGMSPSALRHYFASQDDLLGFALASVVERARTRVTALLPELHGLDGACRLLEELLPLDPVRREEMTVYLAFLDRAHAVPTLHAIRTEAETAVRAAVVRAIGLVAEAGALGAGRTPEGEAARLYPLLDGLALHGTAWPDRYPDHHLRAVVRSHLRELGSALPEAVPGDH